MIRARTFSRLSLVLGAFGFWGLAACAGDEPLPAQGSFPGPGTTAVTLPTPNVAGSQARPAVDAASGVLPAPPPQQSVAGAGSQAVIPPPAMVPPAAVGGMATGGVTYHRDIRPLIEARCLGCHVDGGAAHFSLDGWAQVDSFKELIVAAVQAHRMPPWPADDSDCTKQRHSQRLTAAQLALFAMWQAGGYPEGSESDFAPLVEEPMRALGEPTMIVSPQPYQLTAGREHYQCQQTDADITEDTWVVALDVVPEHSKYVHHAIVSVGNGMCSALSTTAENIYSYRPGSRTVVFEPGDALLLRAGSRIAIEYHFNTMFEQASATLPTDQSPLRLWTLPKGQKPERAIARMPHHILSLSIPVGAQDLSFESTTALSGEYASPGAEIIGMSPHMHYLGQRFKETVRTSDGKTTCLVDIPDWDQAWQLDYFFEPDAYIKVGSGASVWQECVYSNRPEDQGTDPNGKPFTPQYTTFGEDTRQEMCLGYVWIRYPLGGAR